MLTELKLMNFIHFKEKQSFSFENGLNILLGTNHTGKTSVFEAIRRCMSMLKNGGLSNPHDASKFSYVTCSFQNSDTTVYSSVIRTVLWGQNITLKAVQCIKNGTEIKAIDIIGQFERKVANKELDAEGFGFNFDKDDTEDETQQLDKDGCTKLEKSVNEYLEKRIGEDLVKTFYLSSSKDIKETECEKILRKHVDEQTVIIFPFRSFSQYQWTKSKRDMKDLAGDILDEITLKKEIVYWYLEADEEIISQDIRRLEEKYFDLITGNSGFRFSLVDGKRVGVRNENFAKRNPATENLLKIPEGIYEAKSAAIILAVPTFQTICLDDAERGMHPQMVERLRDLVLQDISDKAILLITHHPAFLAPWNISRTFFFQRQEDDDGYKFAVKPLRKYATEFGGKGPQIITSGQFPSLFFAERICWVEGQTDYLFLTALKYEFVRKDSVILKEYCAEGEDLQKRFRDFLSTLHIVSMGGEAGKCFFRQVSKTLQLTHFFILDFDAVKENLPACGEKRKSGQPKSYQEMAFDFCDVFILDKEHFQGIQSLEKLLSSFEKCGIFFWKLMDVNNYSSGTIENAVYSLSKAHPDLDRYLQDKKINLLKKGERRKSATRDRKLSLGDSKMSAEKGQAGETELPAEKRQLEETKLPKLSKLFKDKTITNDDITSVVRTLLDYSKNDTKSDFHRLVAFLKMMCPEPKRTLERTNEEASAGPVVKKKKVTDTHASDVN